MIVRTSINFSFFFQLCKDRSWQTLKNKMKTISLSQQWDMYVPSTPRFCDARNAKDETTTTSTLFIKAHVDIFVQKMYENRDKLNIDDSGFWKLILKDTVS